MAANGILPLSMGALLFSFRGRISRQPFWLASLAMIALTLVLVALVAIVFFASGSDLVDDIGALAERMAWLLVLYVPLLWIGLAVAAKRLHDRNKSAWWLLLFYVAPAALDGAGGAIGGMGFVLSLASIALTIWAMVELGLLRGTAGPNAYGPDPLDS